MQVRGNKTLLQELVDAKARHFLLGSDKIQNIASIIYREP